VLSTSEALTRLPDAFSTRRSVRASWWWKRKYLSLKYGGEQHAYSHATTGGMSSAVASSITLDRRAATRSTYGASATASKAGRSAVTPGGSSYCTG